MPAPSQPKGFFERASDHSAQLRSRRRIESASSPSKDSAPIAEVRYPLIAV